MGLIDFKIMNFILNCLKINKIKSMKVFDVDVNSFPFWAFFIIFQVLGADIADVLANFLVVEALTSNADWK